MTPREERARAAVAKLGVIVEPPDMETAGRTWKPPLRALLDACRMMGVRPPVELIDALGRD